MVTKGFLDGFIKRFEYCKDIDLNWNTRLFEKTDSESWSAILIDRSKDLRDSYKINEDNIKSIKDVFNNELTDKEYRLIADAALKIYQDGYDDYYVFSILLLPCIKYFESINDLDYLIPLIHAYCFEEEQFYNDVRKDSIYKYSDIIKFKNEYKNIKSKYARLTIFKSYSNALSAILNARGTDFKQMYDLYTEALEFWNTKDVQDLDGGDEEFLYFIDRITDTILLFDNPESLNEEELNIYEELLMENVKKDDDPNSYSATKGLFTSFLKFRDRMTDEEYLEKLLNYFDHSYELLDIDGDPNIQQDLIDDCYNIIDSVLATINNIEERKEFKEIRKRMNQLRIFLKSIPYTFYNSEMNRYCYEFYKRVYMYMSFEEKKEFIFEVIMFRQPITCIHSLMVEKISEILTKYILKNKPELFIGILNCKNIEDVNNYKFDILEYVKENALFHDVGKVLTPHIINTQNRALCELEFDAIRKHPDGGPSFLDNDKDFEKYYDVMRGHHKYFDGSKGYPENFNNLESPVKIIIDIVTVADATDAATDILGRNYTTGKTFDKLLEEFIEGSGTRYNNIIVDMIKNDQALIDELTEMTTDGRFETYRYVYSKYINY